MSLSERISTPLECDTDRADSRVGTHNGPHRRDDQWFDRIDFTEQIDEGVHVVCEGVNHPNPLQGPGLMDPFREIGERPATRALSRFTLNFAVAQFDDGFYGEQSAKECLGRSDPAPPAEVLKRVESSHCRDERSRRDEMAREVVEVRDAGPSLHGLEYEESLAKCHVQ